MGKKIPGAKHRTVKYPEQQKRLRELKLYNKVNNPPKVLDDQEVPKGVRKIKEFKEKFKILEEKEERKKQDKKNRKLQKTLKEAQFKVDKRNLLERFLKQDSNEDQVIVINEMRRVKRAQPIVTVPKQIPETITISNESSTPSHGTKQKAKQERNNQQAKQRKLLTELSNEYPSLNIKPDNSNDNKSGRRQMKRNPNKKLNKREKDKLKMKTKQSEKEEEVDRSAPVYDKVEFGEIVHAPPKLSKRPRNTEVESKPGKKSQNLLLASMLNPSLKSSPSQPAPRKFNYSTNLTGKRKDLSMADRRRLDKEQAMAIAAYKKLKADRWQAGQGK